MPNFYHCDRDLAHADEQGWKKKIVTLMRKELSDDISTGTDDLGNWAVCPGEYDNIVEWEQNFKILSLVLSRAIFKTLGKSVHVSDSISLVKRSLVFQYPFLGTEVLVLSGHYFMNPSWVCYLYPPHTVCISLLKIIYHSLNPLESFYDVYLIWVILGYYNPEKLKPGIHLRCFIDYDKPLEFGPEKTKV